MRDHQTVRLRPGRHRSPDDGVCAMELASMLAHEPFSDRPKSVCPVVAGFLRSYNDHVDDARRRDLFAYAARAVGSRAGPVQEQRRAKMCRRWARMSRAVPPPHVRVLCRLLRCQGPEIEAVYAARAAAADPALHGEALALLDELIGSSQSLRLNTVPTPLADLEPVR